MKTRAELKAISDRFFARCNKLAASAPWAVCIGMHEYARNLYPADPYIPFREGLSPTERVYSTTRNLIDFLDTAGGIGQYDQARVRRAAGELKERTGEVYGRLWSKFSHRELTEKAASLLERRLELNGIDTAFLTDRKAIDIGCGSGRFTMALRALGCRPVVGVDYGSQGLRIARSTLRKSRYKDGVSFRKSDVMNLPYRDGAFDFVFCNGVLHHTSNLERGVREMLRVARRGARLWLYLYGDGGIFWYARKKMPRIMKNIPQQYTMSVLDLLGMPRDRFIFTDNWYVPIEQHSTDRQVRALLRRHGAGTVERLRVGLPTDLEFHALKGGKEGKVMWGEGELRYLLEKK